jgi:hypothetical protein
MRYPWSVKRTCDQCGGTASVQSETLVDDPDKVALHMRCGNAHHFAVVVDRDPDHAGTHEHVV